MTKAEVATKRPYRKHGLRNTRFYVAWYNAKMRTTNPKDRSYRHYGKRGIRMASVYEQDPRAMFEDLGECPPGMTLDRIYFNKGYVPGNLQWADWFHQANNRRTSVKYDHEGREYTMSELARKVGIPYHTLNKRIKILGWSVEKAIATPKHKWVKQTAA